MLKKILVILAMLYAAACFAAVDANKASATELDGIKGIGPVMSKRIIDERKKGEYKNWDDLMSRVKGIAPLTARKYSAGGLTVKGEEFKRMDEPSKAEKKAEKKDDKKAEKKDDKAAAAKPAASAKK
jgi:competence protein ComEA